MSYNRKKMQKNAEASPVNREQSLQEYNKNWKNTLPESIPNYNGLLDETRTGGVEGSPQTTEAQMDAPRKESEDANGRITEGQMDKRDSYIKHRQADHYDQSPMMPINAVSGALDSKFHKEYSKASKGGESRLLDKDPGSQMDGPATKVNRNVPSSGTQLQNLPSRFYDGDAGRAIMASLRDSDFALFNLYYAAAAENRNLTAAEKVAETKLAHIKKMILSQIKSPLPTNAGDPNAVQNIDPNAPPVPPSDPLHPHGDINSEFYPQKIPGGQVDPLGESSEDTGVDDDIINHLLGINQPNEGVGVEDINHPNYAGQHLQERQEIEFDPFSDDDAQDGQPRF